jgi:two-component system, NtrC family, sensor kinase
VGRELKTLAETLQGLNLPEATGTPLFATMTEARQALLETEEGASRIHVIVQDLKTLARQGIDELRPVRLSEVLDAALRMGMHELKQRARVVREYQEVPLVSANEQRLVQVFLNLLINASHAISPGATEQNTVKVSLRVHDDGRVMGEVSDTGSGIPPEILPRIFDPFFTTKPGVGTGLGLPICQTIVTGLGGEIRVESVLGKGTAMQVLLPRIP